MGETKELLRIRWDQEGKFMMPSCFKIDFPYRRDLAKEWKEDYVDPVGLEVFLKGFCHSEEYRILYLPVYETLPWELDTGNEEDLEMDFSDPVMVEEVMQ